MYEQELEYYDYDCIEQEVDTVKLMKPYKFVGCILYKNARVDMQLMDETFGPEYWKREHVIINNNNYCRVSVFNKDIKEWVSKEDCGTESMKQKEKGEASDSFKRACVNWGIGRELYTAPFTWITNIKTYESKGKWKTFDKFTVKEIDYNEYREIKNLIIVNQNNVEVFVKLENKKPNIPTPTPKSPVEKSEANPEPKPNFKKKLGELLVEMYGKENAATELLNLTTFINKDGKKIPGKSDLKKLSDAQAQTSYGKLKKLKEEKEETK
jgi:hypothetical protein